MANEKRPGAAYKNKTKTTKRRRPAGWGKVQLTKAEQARFKLLFGYLDNAQAVIDVLLRTYHKLRESGRADDLALFQSTLLRVFDRQSERALLRTLKAAGEVNSKSEMISGDVPTELPTAYPYSTRIAHQPAAKKQERAPLAVLYLQAAFEFEKPDLFKTAARNMSIVGWKDEIDLKRFFDEELEALSPARGRPRYNIYLRYVAKHFGIGPEALQEAVRVCRTGPLAAPITKASKSKSSGK